jgi:hypothetical protein
VQGNVTRKCVRQGTPENGTRFAYITILAERSFRYGR